MAESAFPGGDAGGARIAPPGTFPVKDIARRQSTAMAPGAESYFAIRKRKVEFSATASHGIVAVGTLLVKKEGRLAQAARILKFPNWRIYSTLESL